MGVTHWWLGEPTDTGANVVCRSNSTATVRVSCNGQTFIGAADTEVDDGVVQIAVSGLVPGIRYPYQIDGVAAGTLRAKKSSGDIWVASGSCWQSITEDILAYRLLREYDLDVYFALGDFPYCNSSFDIFGESTLNVEASMADGKNPQVYYAHHRQQRAEPGIRELMREVPFWYMPDDHEYPFDNGCPTLLAEYQMYVGGAEDATQDDLDEAWAASRLGSEAYSRGFSTGFNSDAATVDADAIYGSYKVGPIEFFLIDCCNYRDPTTDAADPAKTMLGANQKARLLDAVQNSTATFKAIVTGKQLFRGGGNTDSWNNPGNGTGYEHERDAILYAFRNVTGLFMVAGDQHLQSDQQVSAGELGEDMPAISCLVGCPTGVKNNTSGRVGYTVGVKYKINGYPQETTGPQDNVVALFRITADRVYRYLLSTRTGLISCGHINAGSNQVQYQRARIG